MSDQTPWYRITNSADTSGTTEIQLYDDIGMWGVSAAEFAQELKTVNTSHITLRISSTGGNVFEGITILNALRNHPAKVTTVVDGLAASIASVIAMAGDEVVMSRGSQMMIHNASGLASGDAKVMFDLGAVLLKQNENIASIYAERAGGTVEDWTAAMEAETWYLAQEAVDAGLADRIDKATQPADVAAQFDLSIFNHAGRGAAPSPYMPPRPQIPVSAAAAARRMHNAPVRGAIPQGEGEMQFSDEQLATLRDRLGVAADAQLDAAQIVAALSNPEPEPPQEPTPTPSPQPTPDPVPPAPKVAGTMVIDSSAWEATQEQIRALAAKQAKHDREERDQVIDQAVKDGKFAPARKEHWAKLWDADPEGARATIDGLSKNVIPLEALGTGVEDDESFDAELASLFGPKGA